MDLVLNSYGTALLRENEQFAVTTIDGKQLINPAEVKSISISKGARISSDAVLLAIEHEIDILFLDGKGDPKGRVWSPKFGSISTIRRKQLDFTLSSKAVQWIIDIVAQKLENQIALIWAVCPQQHQGSAYVEHNISRIADYKNKISHLSGETVSDIGPSLRGWEGAASKIYFDTLCNFLPEDYRFNGRSHPATDVFNALLNYAYGILYGKIEGTLIKAGIDPYIGVFHREDYNRPVLVFDIIELYRVWADFVVVNLCMQKAIIPECYSVQPNGTYWLEPLGRRMVIQGMSDYLEDLITIKGQNRSRNTHLQLYAHSLAQMFLNFKNK
ncbi:MAG: CRISPR-associated endonuclease Cas1 [Bacteroidota bacterium]|jgi:CRISPR-associated protein Cas1|nr:CRISPR-associated endonuclease Cas1 [Bacteroidales bacterium]